MTHLFVFIAFSQTQMRPGFHHVDGFPRREMITFVGEQGTGVPLSSTEDQDRCHRRGPLETFVLVIQGKILILQPNDPSVRTETMLSILNDQLIDTRIPDLGRILRTDETQRSKGQRSSLLSLSGAVTCFH